MARQNMAILARGKRRAEIKTIRAPDLGIHGSADPLIPLAAGRETARPIPAADLTIIDGMGHDMATGVWGQIAAAISRHAKKANVAPPTGPG
jgi:pimeloyl-ACP methyl ester carboxylesterase